MSSISVLILMGSDSDAPVMQAAVDVLREFEMPCEMTVASAHRSPERVMRLVAEAPGRGVRLFIVGAGAAAHLGGVVAAHTTLPVIGVPIDSSALKGMDALLSTVQMPPGVPVATVSIGKPGATNAGVLAVQMLALADASLAERLTQYKKKLADKVEQAAATAATGVKYSIVTFGCRVNQADSLRLEEELRARGGAESPSSAADVVIVNTCSVTATADQGARQTIRRVARENPAARIVVTGCYATRCAGDVEVLPGVIRVVPNDQKLDIVGLLADAGELTTSARFGEGGGPCGAAIEPGVAGRTAFTMRVQTGCEERCSYCIIPTTRGSSRSIPIDEVVREVVRVAASGFKEIALTGVHLGSYGRDLRPERSLHGAAARAVRRPARRHVSRQLAGADGLHAGHRRSRRLERRPVRAALPPAAAARQRSDAAADAPPVHVRRLPPAGGQHCRAPAARVDRNGFDRGISWRERRRLRRERGVSTVGAAVASARLPLLGPSGHRGHRAARQGGGTGDSRARRAAASDRREAFGALSRRAGRHDPAWADARGRLARRHRQLSESQDSRGTAAQRARAREGDGYGQWGCLAAGTSG